jgi:RHS repeat-associated protein
VMQDRQYKVMAIGDASGNVRERYSYTAYGDSTVYDSGYTVRATSSYVWSYRYTSRRLDLETGLYYFRNRYYDTGLGRFCSKDPIGYLDGPNLYNAYFVPNTTDPSGLAFDFRKYTVGILQGPRAITRIKLHFIYDCTKFCRGYSRLTITTFDVDVILKILAPTSHRWADRRPQYNFEWGFGRTNAVERQATLAHEIDHREIARKFYTDARSALNRYNGRIYSFRRCVQVGNCLKRGVDAFFRRHNAHQQLFERRPLNQGGMYQHGPFNPAGTVPEIIGC